MPSEGENTTTRRCYRGGQVLVDGELVRADLVVDGGLIAEVVIDPPNDGLAEGDIDCGGLVIAPGLIDLQCNGAGGVDITTEPDRILDVGAALPRFGVTSFLPTVVTTRASTRAAAIDAITELRRQPRATAAERRVATPLGLHFEGPMISRNHLGAHVSRYAANPESMVEEIDTWASSGVVSLVTLAPELDGALGVVETLVAAGVVVSAGHTGMSPSDFATARSAGLSYVTHLYNAMAPFGHRSPGPIGAVLADPSVTVGVICDGIHVDPTAVEMAWRSLGPHRMSLVSDASPALGAPYGRFKIGGFEIIHDETGVRTVDGVLAGSALELDRAVRNLMAYTGCSLADALATVTSTPADLLGLADRGRIRVGARADLTIVDPAGNLQRTIIAGETAWDRS
ncbi:MAG TPA: N-acetylglucosamine-6-phosphate deacetylase [Ilumatobacteraceae bacterium]|nr:N-acetylglucosamine-6-phosphate deacetylase [Ilumatobacteraceae bacterium]